MTIKKYSSTYWAIKLLKIIASAKDYDYAIGDLEETYDYIAEDESPQKANRWFWREVLKSFPGFVKNGVYRRSAMIRNYFKIAFRNIIRNKVFALINILGLAVGMACFILITLWIQDELSYDKFHANKDNLYLLTIIHPDDVVDPNVPYALAPRLADEFPEFSQYTRIYEYGLLATCTFKHQPKDGLPVMFYEDNVNFVDISFFSMFSFPFVFGSPETAFRNPNSLVITDKMATKYFGHDNPLGKVLTLNNRDDFVVSGVIHIPSNSHLQLDFLTPLPDRLIDDWNWRDPSYILLDKNASVAEVKQKIAGALIKHSPYKFASTIKVDLLPLTKVHLNFGRRTYVYIFSLISTFILLIACINYMNLATACSANRSREVGLRKVMGAKRPELVQQFLGESILMSAIGLGLSLVLVRIGLPLLNSLTSKQLAFSLLSSHAMYLYLFGLIFVVGLASGAYPAFFLSSNRPADTLKSSSHFKSKRSSFRVVTVVGQFAISILLIACTAVVFQQLGYVQNRPLGLNTDYVIKVPINRMLLGRLRSFKDKLLQNPNILNVTAGQSVPYNEDYKTQGLEWDGKDPDFSPNVRYTISYFDYLETFEMEVVQGRSFNSGSSADTTNFVINEEAVKYLGMVDPVGQRLKFWQNEGTIIGVAKNYHHVSLHREIMPHVFCINPRHYGTLRFIFIKISSENIQDSLKYIRETATTFAPDFPYEYAFLDQDVEDLYQAEQKLGKIFSSFAFLAVFISCLGIFGLASFTAERRTKEIGIRKVLGASVSQIVMLLSKEFSRWILLANLIAWPIGWYAMHKWLQNFAYRSSLNPLLFLLAGVLSLVIAALPVGYQAIKAAIADPISSLRYE
ncbi:MAG: ABC transporter permease [Candidatus Aminicenantes bacterium]|nr:MAG: ABC transporter permease [Candidatus Aminicenantes bacterium]